MMDLVVTFMFNICFPPSCKVLIFQNFYSLSVSICSLLSILSDHNNAVVWMISIIHLISNSSSLLCQPLGTVPHNCITVTLMSRCFFILCQDPSICLSFRFLLYSLCAPLDQQNPLDGKLCPFSFFFFFRFGLLARIRWSIYIWNFQRIVWVSFSMTVSGLCIYHLVV